MTLGFILVIFGSAVGIYFIYRGVNKLVNKLFGKEAIHEAEDLVYDFKTTKEVSKIIEKEIK